MSGEVPEAGDASLGGVMPGFGAASRIAGYRLEQRIGVGGMAMVFRARGERLGRLVALKILAPGLAGDEVFRRRFIRESQAAAAVDHPHIIPVFAAGETDGAVIISPVASALDAAHAAGLVHRDVKPANILPDTQPGRPDHVYLADFGLKGGMSAVTMTSSGQSMGTPAYMAPEQIEGRTVDGQEGFSWGAPPAPPVNQNARAHQPTITSLPPQHGSRTDSRHGPGGQAPPPPAAAGRRLSVSTYFALNLSTNDYLLLPGRQ